MDKYLAKHWPHSSVSVSCRVYASKRRADEYKRLRLTAEGIQLSTVGPSSATDVIPWLSILGASESTRSIRHRFLSVYEGSEIDEEKEFIVYGCVFKPESAGCGGLLGALHLLAKTVLPAVFSASKPGNERMLVQWVFRCNDEDGDAVARRTVKAIRFLADPRVKQSIKSAEKLLDPFGILPPRKFMVLINPAGGNGGAQHTFEKEVAPMLKQANVEVEQVITREAGHATEILAQVPLYQYECIVAVGGDGLLSESKWAEYWPYLSNRKTFNAMYFTVLQGLMGRKDWQQAILQPLGIIPGGSGNGLSASLLSRANERFEALNAAYSLVKGCVQELDLFSATNGIGTTMFGFLSFEWAFIADMDIRSEQYRFMGDMRFFVATILQIFGFGQTKYHGQLRYLLSHDKEPQPIKHHAMHQSGKALAQQACISLRTEADDENWLEMDGPFYMFWSMNVSHAAADAYIAPPADIADGYFQIMLVSGENYSRFGLAKLMMGIEKGSHINEKRVQLIRTRAFSVRSSNADDRMCIDGEPFQGPEVKIEMHRALGRVLCLPATK